jgi:hypothetical protein
LARPDGCVEKIFEKLFISPNQRELQIHGPKNFKKVGARPKIALTQRGFASWLAQAKPSSNLIIAIFTTSQQAQRHHDSANLT